MHSSVISSIAAMVSGVAGCSLLLAHLLSKNQAYRSVAWLSLVLSCTAVLSSATELIIQQNETLNNCAENEASVATTETIIPINRTIPDRRRLVVVPRREWVAQLPKSTTSLRHPVEYVVLSQTATEPCTTQTECTLTVRYLQVFHVEGKKWMDIAYNFLVAGDGQAYEGRGWDVVGAHTAAGFNNISIGISFVGRFSDVLPPPVQIRACKLLIGEGVRLGKISPNYKLIADRQVSSSENPGQKFYDDLQTWDHWTSDV